MLKQDSESQGVVQGTTAKSASGAANIKANSIAKVTLLHSEASEALGRIERLLEKDSKANFAFEKMDLAEVVNDLRETMNTLHWLVEVFEANDFIYVSYARSFE